MESRIEEFREFVNRHPLIRNEVRIGKRTWQNIYEEWALYGEHDRQWEQYVDHSNINYTSSNSSNNNDNNNSNNNYTNPDNNSNNGNNENTKSETNINNVNFDSIKSIFNYVQKMNPDSVNKTLNTVQKVIQIVQTVGGGGTRVPQSPLGMTSMFNDWWD